MGAYPIVLVIAVMAAAPEHGADCRYLAARDFAVLQGLVGQRHHQYAKHIHICVFAFDPVPGVIAIAGGGTREIDRSAEIGDLFFGNVELIFEHAELRRLFFRRKQREAGNIMQEDGAFARLRNSVAIEDVVDIGRRDRCRKILRLIKGKMFGFRFKQMPNFFKGAYAHEAPAIDNAVM